jgi:hypothetical protein
MGGGDLDRPHRDRSVISAYRSTISVLVSFWFLLVIGRGAAQNGGGDEARRSREGTAR